MTTRSDVQDLLASGMKQKDIATKLNISEARVSQLKKALKSGLKLIPPSPSVSRTVGEATPTTPIQPSKKERQFLHKLTRSYPLPTQVGIPIAKQWSLHNNEQRLGEYKGVSFILTTKNIEWVGVQLWDTLAVPSPTLLRKGERLCDRLMVEMEQEYGFKTQRGSNGELLGHTGWSEIAITDTEGAKHLSEQHKGKIVLYESPRKHTKLYVDRTPLPASFESEDALILDRWRRGIVNPIEKGKWSATTQLRLNQIELEELRMVIESQARLTDLVSKLIEKVKLL